MNYAVTIYGSSIYPKHAMAPLGKCHVTQQSMKQTVLRSPLIFSQSPFDRWPNSRGTSVHV